MDPDTTTIVVASVTGAAGVLAALGGTALGSRSSRKSALASANRERRNAIYDERRETYAAFFALAGRLEAQAMAAQYEGGIPDPSRSNHEAWEMCQSRLRLLTPLETFAVLDAYATGVGMLWNIGWAGWNPAHPLYSASMKKLEALEMGSPEALDLARSSAFEAASKDLEVLRRS